ncbi:MAG: hypothetical protein PHE67_00740 [Campylobacterales bacterium]|nr:hypothetical protein [Campylobacterales bacterium]
MINNTNQVTTRAPEKYTFGSGIKNLLDRLQDMYTNRVDAVGMTGDGFAAAHESEIDEIFWVYLKFFMFEVGLLGAVTFVVLYAMSFIGGLFITLGFFKSGMIAIAVGCIPLGYITFHLTYAGYLTYRGIKWATGEATNVFYKKMEDSFHTCVRFTIWHIITSGVAILLVIMVFFSLSGLSDWLMELVLKTASLSSLTTRSDDIILNSHIVAVISSVASFAVAYFSYQFITVSIIDTNTNQQEVNIKNMQAFLYRDAVDEAKNS